MVFQRLAEYTSYDDFEVVVVDGRVDRRLARDPASLARQRALRAASSTRSGPPRASS
jgi:hypothetical protein